MKAKQVTIYKIDGQQFEHIADLKSHIENKIGKLLDNYGDLKNLKFQLSLVQKLAVLDFIIDNRKILLDILDGEILDSAEDWQTPNLNFFDECDKSKKAKK